ncbi:DUF2029 domain-containing protein [Streptomyces sp. P38-E01]|uniref:DUF2029 domain-containing protein n=1 Tax=Streptomyces tardus TaxID=2780544 RepID=A0A949N9E5_9ACTN|nr:glycosyltransferase family 87 protein [Streptomyces tardus]MBU7599511.1 DUF2029 domain-containing protein [Streptomyces tardus]
MRPTLPALLTAWAATRAVLLLYVLQVLTLPGPVVTTDVEVIYQGWSEVLRTGVFPEDDVTWQYPPAAALPVLAPLLVPFLEYAPAFYTLAVLTDTVVLTLLLRAGRGRGRSRAGAWLWVAGVPLLGPTVYARYDLMVTAVAVAALLCAVRRPRVAGALVAFGALLKVWPALLLAGAARGRSGRRMWGAAVLTGLGVAGAFALAMPNALNFLTAQRDRGVEVESLGALVFHIARHFGWEGRVELHYGSMEFLGPHVSTVADLSLLLSLVAFGWLLWWRVRAVEWTPTTCADAAFAALLLFTVTSRVISPQYMVWLVGVAAVCLTLGSRRQRTPALLVLAATGATLLEFPIFFGEVVTGEPLGVALLVLRNGLLVVAGVASCRALWHTTVTAPRRRAAESAPDRTGAGTTPRDERDPLLTR